jgi:hypothetical protein
VPKKKKRKGKLQKLADELDMPVDEIIYWQRKGMPTDCSGSACLFLFEQDGKETIASMAKKLGVSPKTIKNYKSEGMPFNEKFFAVEDAKKWISENKKIKRRTLKKTIPEKCKILGIGKTNFDNFSFYGMDTENMDKAKEWIAKNTIQVGTRRFVRKNLDKRIATDNLTKTERRRILTIGKVFYEKCISEGMPKTNIRSQQLWIEFHTQSTGKRRKMLPVHLRNCR